MANTTMFHLLVLFQLDPACARLKLKAVAQQDEHVVNEDEPVNLQFELMTAATQGNIEECKRLVELGVDLSEPFPEAEEADVRDLAYDDNQFHERILQTPLGFFGQVLYGMAFCSLPLSVNAFGADFLYFPIFDLLQSDKTNIAKMARNVTFISKKVSSSCQFDNLNSLFY